MLQFSSVPWLGHRGDMRDHSAEIFFQSFLQETLVSSGMGRDVHSLMLSIQHFLCRPRRHPSYKVPWRMILERLSWHAYPNYASFRLLTAARRGSCGPTKKLVLLRTQLLVLCFQVEDAQKFPQTLGFEGLDPFFPQSASRVHVSQP